MENFAPSINARNLKSTPKYVCWIDTMGTQNTMSESLAKAANYILKLHACIINAAHDYEGSVTVYPVMDGAYITCTKKADITNVIKSVYRDLFKVFIEEQEIDKRFVIRGALAFGDVIEGKITDRRGEWYEGGCTMQKGDGVQKGEHRFVQGTSLYDKALSFWMKKTGVKENPRMTGCKAVAR